MDDLDDRLKFAEDTIYAEPEAQGEEKTEVAANISHVRRQLTAMRSSVLRIYQPAVNDPNP